MVVITAKTATQISKRPVGYHSIGRRGRCSAVAGVRGGGYGPAEHHEMTQPPGRQCHGDCVGDGVGYAEQQIPSVDAAATPPMAALSGPQPIAATINGSGAR